MVVELVSCWEPPRHCRIWGLSKWTDEWRKTKEEGKKKNGSDGDTSFDCVDYGYIHVYNRKLPSLQSLLQHLKRQGFIPIV